MADRIGVHGDDDADVELFVKQRECCSGRPADPVASVEIARPEEVAGQGFTEDVYHMVCPLPVPAPPLVVEGEERLRGVWLCDSAVLELVDAAPAYGYVLSAALRSAVEAVVDKLLALWRVGLEVDPCDADIAFAHGCSLPSGLASCSPGLGKIAG